MKTILKIFLILFFISSIRSDESDHIYKMGESVPLYASVVGPHHNPQETYPFYSLPFCKPDNLDFKSSSIGEAFQGIELVKSKNKIVYLEPVTKRTLCALILNEALVKTLSYAVNNEYYYTLYLDDLPMWAMVGGHAKKGRRKNIPFIYTHQKYSIGYNGHRIVEVNLTAQNPVLLKVDSSLTFTYSVKWKKSDITYERRFHKYLDDNFFEHKIHWFSIFNSFMMVIFLAGLVFIILIRTLKTELAKIAKEAEAAFESGDELPDESGWKQLHGDVFRPPMGLELFSSLLGTGWQLTILMFFLIFFAIIGTYYDDRGALLTTFIIIYCLTSVIAGYYSSSFYIQNGGESWKLTMFITSLFFPGVCGIIGSILNTIAIFYQSASAVAFGYIILIIASWIFITSPLVVVGTILGRNMTPKIEKLRYNQYPSPIPTKSLFLNRFTLILISGILPFGSIFIETYFIFTSFWNYKYYYVYGFMLLVYIILIIVTSCVSIVSTYFLLNAEDHRWQWTSFMSAASISFYVYFYSIYFYMVKTKMTGLLQFSFYYGYTLLLCLGLALVCGTIGFSATKMFVTRIYRDLKAD